MMMIIQIDDIYLVEVDQFNFTLKKKRIAEKGKNIGAEYFEVCGYYPTLKSAICKYVELVALDEIEITDIFNAAECIKAVIERRAEEIEIKISEIEK